MAERDAEARLRTTSLFADLDDAALAGLRARAEEVHLAPGEVLFAEGDPGTRAFVIVEGEIEIVKATGGPEVALARRGPGEVIGEMALLESSPRMATARAAAPTVLLAADRATLDDLLSASPSAARALFVGALARWRETEVRLRQTERMAQLGTLTAGVAHELNNPAAAVEQAAGDLAAAVDEHHRALAALEARPLDAAGRPALDALLARARAVDDHVDDLDALARADREEALEAWLAERGLPEPWRSAPDLVALGIGAADLDPLVGPGASPDLGAVVTAVVATARVHGLVAQVRRGGHRIAEVVRALRSYSYLDRGERQDVDVVAGIEDTLVLLRSRLRGVEVVRRFAPDLPTVEGHGAELNQVWTNLVANALDALAEAGTEHPTITLSARAEGDRVVVEVEDDGPGIPEDVRDRVFDPFFTTKAPGQGTGLGLDISWNVVVVRHHGELTVVSEPGRTTFRVALPRHAP